MNFVALLLFVFTLFFLKTQYQTTKLNLPAKERYSLNWFKALYTLEISLFFTFFYIIWKNPKFFTSGNALNTTYTGIVYGTILSVVGISTYQLTNALFFVGIKNKLHL